MGKSYGKYIKGQNGLGKAKYHYVKKNKVTDIEVDVDLSRFQRQFGDAQKKLDQAVMTSMVPFMPMQSGAFINVTRGMSAAIAGSGTVIAAAPPMGRFLYDGKTMVDEVTGSPWARKGARKVLVSEYTQKTNATPNLSYSKAIHPDATDHWFDKAKAKDLKVWVDLVKRTAGGG